MRYSSKLRFGAILSVVAAAAAVLAVAAGAGPPFRDTIHEEFSFADEDFCGAGLTVEVAVVLDIRVQAVAHGPDGLVYFLQRGTQTDVLTNLDNGTSLTSVADVIEKDMRVTDNGDGTLTVLILATGNSVLYAEDGNGPFTAGGGCAARIRLLRLWSPALTKPRWCICPSRAELAIRPGLEPPDTRL